MKGGISRSEIDKDKSDKVSLNFQNFLVLTA